MTFCRENPGQVAKVSVKSVSSANTLIQVEGGGHEWAFTMIAFPWYHWPRFPLVNITYKSLPSTCLALSRAVAMLLLGSGTSFAHPVDGAHFLDSVTGAFVKLLFLEACKLLFLDVCASFNSAISISFFLRIEKH